jgi:DNA-binding transcriptional LysR family regulator
LAEVLLLDVLREVHHEAPGVAVEFRLPSNTAAVDLENGEVDFVINPARFTTPNQASTVLFEDSYVLVADRGNPLASKVTLDKYKTLRHVTLELNGRPQFESWFISEHGELPHMEVTVNNFGLLPQLVIGTSRVATMHSRMALQAAKRWPVKVLPLAFDAPRLVETLQWHRYRDLDPGSQWLREKILAHAQRLPPVEQLND